MQVTRNDEFIAMADTKTLASKSIPAGAIILTIAEPAANICRTDGASTNYWAGVLGRQALVIILPLELLCWYKNYTVINLRSNFAHEYAVSIDTIWDISLVE